jgi:4-amino-4-deoxy-L-arabinose transferase-like glycosyltransferase
MGVVLALGFVWTLLEGNYNQFGSFLVAGFLLVATVPLARHAARVENWPGLSSLLMAAMVLRLGGSVARYLVAYGLYGGIADASTYNTVALQHYQAFRHLHVFWPNTSVYHNVVPWADTVIYAFVGPTELGSFLVFAWFNFLGCYLFYRAFRIAFPEGDGRRYALLVLLLPSLLYWPSSLGKEGWMMFALGLASYGLARVLAGRFGGYTALLAGVGGMLLVRPHLALIFLPAALLSIILRRRVPGGRRPLARVIGVLVIVLASLAVVGKVQSYFGIKNLDVQTVTQELKTTRTQTAEGNSAFTPPNAQSPLGYPEAAVTVLFRPFPWEARSSTVLVSSAEGLLLLGLTVGSWRRLRRLPHFLVRNPYVMFSFMYCALFILAFANFSNFGILARERTQMLPMVLVLLALPSTEVQKGVAKPMVEPERAVAHTGRARDLRRYGAARRGNALVQPRPAADRHIAGPYSALGCVFDVEVAAGPFRAALRHSLADLSSASPATQHYRLAAVPDPSGLMAVVTRDGEPIASPTPISEAMVNLVADLNMSAVASRPDKLMLHAGAVSLGSCGVLLPGPSGAGKSTLTAALVSGGFRYLSDELAAIDTLSLEIEPYPKPLTLSGEALAMFGHRVTPDGELKHVVSSSALRGGAVGRSAPARLLVFPSFRSGATSAMTPLSRAEAMIQVANCSFNFVQHGGAWMPLLQRLVAGCWCGRLTIGDLDEATELVTELVRAEGGIRPQ